MCKAAMWRQQQLHQYSIQANLGCTIDLRICEEDWHNDVGLGLCTRGTPGYRALGAGAAPPPPPIIKNKHRN
jgi:hypothetical protein